MVHERLRKMNLSKTPWTVWPCRHEENHAENHERLVFVILRSGRKSRWLTVSNAADRSRLRWMRTVE